MAANRLNRAKIGANSRQNDALQSKLAEFVGNLCLLADMALCKNSCQQVAAKGSCLAFYYHFTPQADLRAESAMAMLMTEAVEQQSISRDDGDFFQKGLPAVFSAILRNTWAEPYLLARQLFGEHAEQVLEPVARAIGGLAGAIAKPAFAAFRTPGEHVLEDTLKATRIAENATGIYGRDYYVTPQKVVRRIHTCPFRNREGARILCHLGEAAGQELFARLVPGCRHKVHVTMARGHDFCEYSYELD